MTSVSSIHNDPPVGTYPGPSQLNSGSELGSKVYDFKGSAASEKTTSLSRRSKDEYKYNLFSMLDEAGNNGCRTGCCHSN